MGKKEGKEADVMRQSLGLSPKHSGLAKSEKHR